MTAPADLSSVEQLPMPDPRGWLALRFLPESVQNAEDATHHNDFVHRRRWRERIRPATDTERLLLAHLGYVVPDELDTVVTFKSPGIWCRRWPVLEEGSTP